MCKEQPRPVYLAGKLDEISINNLEVLLEAFRATEKAFEGVYNQPRIAGDSGEEARELLDEEMERLAGICAEVAAEAERREPTNRDDADRRARLLIRWGLLCGGGWSEIARTAIAAMDARRLPATEAADA